MAVPQYDLAKSTIPRRRGTSHRPHCHSEGRSPVGISWAIVRISTAYQEIATACGLAMTTGIRGWCLRIRPKFPGKESAFCPAAIAVPYISISKYSVGNGPRAVPPMPTASAKSLPPGEAFFGHDACASHPYRTAACGICRNSCKTKGQAQWPAPTRSGVLQSSDLTQIIIKKHGHPKRMSVCVTRTKPDSVSQSCGLRSGIRGISHGLKNSPPDCFSPCCAGPAFRFPHKS